MPLPTSAVNKLGATGGNARSLTGLVRHGPVRMGRDVSFAYVVATAKALPVQNDARALSSGGVSLQAIIVVDRQSGIDVACKSV